MDSDAPIPLIKREADPVPPASEPVVSVPPSPSPVQTRNWGSLIGIIAIVLLIVLAAFYSWGERLALEGAPAAEASE